MLPPSAGDVDPVAAHAVVKIVALLGSHCAAKPSKKDQYERFQRTARDLGVDGEESAKAFERAFSKIVPPKRRVQT
jgi:hypothetical protein